MRILNVETNSKMTLQGLYIHNMHIYIYIYVSENPKPYTLYILRKDLHKGLGAQGRPQKKGNSTEPL